MKNTRLIVMAVVVTTAILAGLAIDIYLTLGLREVEVCEPPEHPASPLPCAAVPTRFVMEYPECADHLLGSMNITNVRIYRFNGTIPGRERFDYDRLAAWRDLAERVNRTSNGSRR